MGRNKRLRKVLTWTSVAVVFTVAGFLTAAWFKPELYSKRMPALSADEIASAMRNDEYFAEHRKEWVLVGGVFDSITYKTNEQVLTFKTSGTSKVRCRIRNVNLRFRKNVPIQLQATGAHRDAQDIIFDDCRPLGPDPDL